jgi:flagellar hook protein FlgE
MPGTSNSNLFLEGKGYFVVKTPEGKNIYTRHGEFTFDNQGVYRNRDGHTVQGYILNDKGEIMQGIKSLNADLYQQTSLNGGAMDIPTTNIKLWIDPNNGKYLGKYDDYEIKGDGVLYGKADKGKKTIPLYKIANMNFHNPTGLYELKTGQYLETEESGTPVIGRGEIRSGLLEMSNVDFKGNIAYFQQAKVQMELTNKLISSNKQLLEEALKLVGS